MTDPVRLTEEERQFMSERANTMATWPLESGVAVVDAMAYMRRLLDSHGAQDRELAEARELVRLLSKRVEWMVEHPGTWGADHACRECRPDSDILIDGFQCCRHRARAWLAATAQEES